MKYLTAARLSFKEYRAASPWWVSLTTSWPRAVLQCLFWVLIGRISGAGAAFAFPGVVAWVLTNSTVISLSDVPMLDRRSGTYFRVRMADVSIFGLYAARSAPWVLDAGITCVLCVSIVGPVLGLGGLAVGLLLCFPLFLLVILTSSAAGLAVGSLGARFNSNVLLGNALCFLMLAAGSLVSVGSRIPALSAVGDVLPMTHGVAAIRDLGDGRPWLREAACEAAVGAGWALLAALSYTVQAWRIRRTGDDFGL
jgi:ABC-2 type transport system permease protein